MQAIVTKYHGPTDTKGSRVSARCDAGRIITDWQDNLNSDQNHYRAAALLQLKLGWDKGYHGRMVGGSLPQGMGGNVYVFVPDTEAPQ